jgi:hypothetical protein
MPVSLFYARTTLAIYLDHLTHANSEREGLLAWILRAPKLFREVSVLSISRAVNCHILSTPWKDTISSSEDCLREPHGNDDYRQKFTGQLSGQLSGGVARSSQST